MHLLVREPGRIAYTVPLRDGLQVGRHAGSDLVLTDAQASRRHARFEAAPDEAGGVAVVDLGSTHGTLVNGERVTRRPLAPGDQVQIGNVVLVVGAGDGAETVVHERVTTVEPPRLPGDLAARRLQLLRDVARAVGCLDDRDALLGRMLEAILDVLGAERALVGLVGVAGRPLERLVRVRGGGTGSDEVVVSRSVLEAVLERRRGLVLRAGGGDGGALPHTLVRERVRSALAAPLVAGERALGLLYVDDRAEAERFGEEDLDFLVALAHLTAAAVDGADRLRRAEDAAAAARAADAPGEMIGTSEPMRRLREQIRRCAAADAHVLVRGESGSGKELVARQLHAQSRRAERPLVAVNCAALPEAMVEGELFGYERGAFTGAVRAHRGRFVLADGGTLFLDEIAELPAAAQAKVLRAIEEGEVQPLGSERTLRVDVRVVSATHKDLEREVAERRFREDLYYRLNVVELVVPPLRERGDDVVRLAEAMLARAAARTGKDLRGFTAAAVAALRAHGWPGNVRELANEVERAVILADGAVIDAADFGPRLRRGAAATVGAAAATVTLADEFAALEGTERRLVAAALERAHGNVSEAARLLGISRIMMKRRLDRFGIGSDDAD